MPGYCFYWLGKINPFAERLFNTIKTAVLLFILLVATANVNAQNFTRLTIDTDLTWARGVSWIDIDNDNDLDLYVTNNDFGGAATFNAARNLNKLFRNDGNDVFVEITSPDMADDTSFTLGQTWADYDNDGHLDLYVANYNAIYERFLSTTTALGSELFRNEGPQDYALARITSGDASSLNRIGGFAAAWADYNNDGFVDLIITTPTANFYPNEELSNVLFDNNGDGTFSNNTGSIIVNGPADAYTIPTWTDYDLDGDMDLFITAGPVQNGVLQPDYFFKNWLVESGSVLFERDLTSNFATDPRDGQQASWVDYDNDGDLDLYVTNFGGTPGVTSGMANDFYRNDNGVYTKITSGSLVTDAKLSIGQTWGDFDNDGDLDLYVTNVTSPSNFGGNNYYRNNGAPNYTFTRVSGSDFVAGSRAGWGASSGDYDNDGDLDLYVTINTLTAGAAQDALYRNDLANGNHWINIKCIGTTSNRAAIGTKVRVKATVFGNTFWQLREISSQNASTGQNSLRAHFGLGDAAVIDSLVIDWPSGTTDIATNMQSNQFVTVTEGGQITAIDENPPLAPADFKLQQNFPNPFNPTTTIQFTLPRAAGVTLKVFDMLGREVATLLEGELRAGAHSVVFEARDLSSGFYFYKLQVDNLLMVKKMLLMK